MPATIPDWLKAYLPAGDFSSAPGWNQFVQDASQFPTYQSLQDFLSKQPSIKPATTRAEYLASHGLPPDPAPTQDSFDAQGNPIITWGTPHTITSTGASDPYGLNDPNGPYSTIVPPWMTNPGATYSVPNTVPTPGNPLTVVPPPATTATDGNSPATMPPLTSPGSAPTPATIPQSLMQGFNYNAALPQGQSFDQFRQRAYGIMPQYKR